ncbi:uncharacterized protein BDR25DRAFT_361070 [Lindgomyces ingoldianus]|uniref:Uncharacterized protein n=1 Tax=Lindgomyces ingoldianus TaxID=673940 RepID=A0ACB6QCY6_9PLEO|nr:uncharacterized protein BDR25DRAFT_361070 [Lindgomyces ingoldianus]KAF2464839.1 hypothetical protein BDR25DRAFT_361070 [Lindgomyces ingoldianus]
MFLITTYFCEPSGEAFGRRREMRNWATKFGDPAARDHSPAAKAYLVQDTLYLHGLGFCYCHPEINEFGIKCAPHPQNPPNLRPTEPCFSRLEGFLKDYKASPSSQESRHYMADKLHPTYFKRVAELCIGRDGDNNLKAFWYSFKMKSSASQHTVQNNILRSTNKHMPSVLIRKAPTRPLLSALTH